MTVAARLHDLRGPACASHPALNPESHADGQALARTLRGAGSDGLVYPSVRHAGGQCVALFYPDLAAGPVPGRPLDYHWNGSRVDLVRNATTREVFAVQEG
jgi:hypothetical protein